MIDITPIHPGEILRKNHMVVRKYSSVSLADELGVETKKLDKLLNEQIGVSKNMSKRLGKLFGNDDEFWFRLQKRYESDLEMTEKGIQPPKQVWKLFKNMIFIRLRNRGARLVKNVLTIYHPMSLII